MKTFRTLKLSEIQKAALRKAAEADHQQFLIDSLTPTRNYPFPLDHTIQVVEMILNAPTTLKHYDSLGKH